jgi:ribosomal protein L37E
MAHQYCIHCGAKNTYESALPKFCSSCGEPFNKASRPKVVEEEEDDVEEIDIDAKSLAKDWSVELDFESHLTFGDLALNPAPRTEYKPRPAKDSLEGKALLKQIQSECAKPKTSREIG